MLIPALLGLLLTLTIPTTAGAQAGDAVRLFDEGNRLYAAGEHDRARDAYEQAAATGYVSGMLFYNLGNVYYRLDEIGQAIRYYEKARRLLPDDPRVEHNIEIARARTVDQFSRVPEPYWKVWWTRLDAVLGARGLFVAGLASYLIAMILLAYRILTGARSPWHRRTLAVSLAAGVLLLGMAYLASVDAADRREAVVISESVALLRGPEPGAEAEMDIHEGVVVDVLGERDGWVEVRLPNGTTGWLGAEALAEI